VIRPTISTDIQRISRQKPQLFNKKLHTPPRAAPRRNIDFDPILGIQPRAIGIARKRG
jgi:hypothetical protein